MYARREHYQALGSKSAPDLHARRCLSQFVAPVAQLEALCLLVQAPGSSSSRRQWGEKYLFVVTAVSVIHDTLKYQRTITDPEWQGVV